mmetsp:Transcript_7589/g.11015  ORF Transcript_7589/g.11015 Transcript_7589/m.11015 type:complete len:113 (-) Transcript_7589:3220-3558(-)
MPRFGNSSNTLSSAPELSQKRVTDPLVRSKNSITCAKINSMVVMPPNSERYAVTLSGCPSIGPAPLHKIVHADRQKARLDKLCPFRGHENHRCTSGEILLLYSYGSPPECHQ